MAMSRTRRAGQGALAAAIFAVLGLLLASAAAAAKPAAAPPGNSAVNQYTESFPSANGPQQSSSTKEGDAGPSPRRALGTRNASRLQGRGPEGQALAELAAATAPGGAKHGAGGGQGGQGADGAPDSQGSSGTTAVLGQALSTSASGKLGPWLPLILLATVVWACLYAWLRRPRSA
jgi:hypothetical protein